jgi:hypothetical protein
MAASLLFLAANVVGDLVWDSYSATSYTIRELAAIDAPSAPLVPLLMLGFGLLSLAFGIGVLAEAGRRPRLRPTGWLLMGIAVMNLTGPFVPMHLRGVEGSLTDRLHIAVTVVTSLLVLAIWFARGTFGRGFRNLSLATLAVMVAFGVLAALDGPKIASGDPTPWVGVTERICIGAYLLWMVALSGALLRTPEDALEHDRRR